MQLNLFIRKCDFLRYLENHSKTAQLAVRTLDEETWEQRKGFSLISCTSLGKAAISYSIKHTTQYLFLPSFKDVMKIKKYIYEMLSVTREKSTL